MPPHSSLPLQDGRVGLPPSSPQQQHQHQHLHNEPYYSNEDIELLHEIVTLGETIYPTLHERDRLPTNALFQAAEQILPAHGYDAENAPSHISRLIFKIGGQRSGETLSEKFRSVLAGMGINIEYTSSVENSPASASRRAPSVRSLATFSDDDTGTLDAIRRRLPRRRHSSVSRPIERPAPWDQGHDLPIRTRVRSVSFTDPNAVPGDILQFNREDSRPISSWAPRNPVNEAERSRPNPENRNQAEHYPIVSPVTHSLGRHAVNNLDTDDEGDDSEEPTQALPVLPYRSHAPTAERASDIARKYLSEYGNVGASARNKERPKSPSTVGDTDHIHHSPRTDGSDVLHRGASDTTVPTVDEDKPQHFRYEPPAVDYDLLEERLRQFNMHDEANLVKDAFVVWRAIGRETAHDNAELWARAAEFDDLDMADEVLEIWNEEAIVAQEQRVEAEVAAEHEAYVEKMERRATRVYEIITIQNALTWWQDQAREEVTRTAVARRHLVRKRAFDGWRAQHIEDETKVRNFVLIHALQKWTQVALHHEVRHQVAIQRHERSLAQEVLNRMYKEQKHIVAYEFLCYNLAEHTFRTWSAQAKQLLDEKDVAVRLDKELTLDEAMIIWHEETEDLRDMAKDAIVQKFARDCQRTLAHWQEQARLERTLRHIQEANDYSDVQRTLIKWRAAAREARETADFADSLILEDPLEQWQCEAKLKLFVDYTNKQLQADVLEHWALEERLAWYSRRLEANLMRRTLNTFLNATRQERSTRTRSVQEADYVDAYYTQAETLDVWLEGVGAAWRGNQNASLVALYRTAKPVFDLWHERQAAKTIRSQYLRREADKASKKFCLSGVLKVWPKTAEKAKRDRLMSSLREFRRTYKVDLARDCMERWWEATAESVDAGREAHGLNVQHKREDVLECLDYWRYSTGRALDIGDVAAEAEIEVYLGSWRAALEEYAEGYIEAENYDTTKTLRRCWDKWEFRALLEHEGMRNMVATVLDKNDKRMCGSVLDEWRLKAIPPEALAVGELTMAGGGGNNSFFVATSADPRMSAISRRSVRQQPQQANPFARSTAPAFSTARVQDESTVAATPFRSTRLPIRGGQFGGSLSAAQRYSGQQEQQQQQPEVEPSQFGQSYNPFQQQRRPSPFERDDQQPHREPETPQVPISQPAATPFVPVSQIGLPRSTLSSSVRPLPFTANLSTAPNFRTSISQLGPMTEFDEESLLPDVETNDPGFMSTPTKRTGMARPLGYASNNPGGGFAATGSRVAGLRQSAAGLGGYTTTPSAILASPHERELRQAYGDGGSRGEPSGGGRSFGGFGERFTSSFSGQSQREQQQQQQQQVFRATMSGANGTGRTRVVDFADIREDSREG